MGLGLKKITDREPVKCTDQLAEELRKPVSEKFQKRRVYVNGPFVYGGTNCTRGWNFADIFFSDSVKIMRFYDFARTSVS